MFIGLLVKFVIFFAEINAERPRFSQTVLEFDSGVPPRGAKQCPQWFALKNVLAKLGIRPDPSLGGSIQWNQCNVEKIRLNLKAINGILDDDIGQLFALRHLDLDDTDIVGNVSSLQGLNQLQFLSLANTKISGDLSSLRELTKLQDLSLSNTKVSGDLSSLYGLSKLTRLSLDETNVCGDLSTLQSFPALELFYFQNDRVTGNLSMHQKLLFLESFDLRNTQVVGSLSSLQSLLLLDEILLEHTHVTGNLSKLENLTKLENLDLGHTKVVGHLSSLQRLTKLEQLFLDGTKIAGDLSSLRSLPKLRRIQLDNVAGDLSTFQSLTELEDIYLHNAQLTGNLSSLQSLASLQRVSLPSTMIVGDLSSFRSHFQLQNIYLPNTEVTGDLSSLLDLSQLKDLFLSNTKVVGNLSSLTKLSIQKLSLYHTQVAGDLSSLQTLGLESLDLRLCPVTGDLSSLQNLTQLQELFLAETQVTGDLSSLQSLIQLESLSLEETQIGGNLSSLQSLSELRDLELSGTEVSGDLSSLQSLLNLRLLSLGTTEVAGDLSSLQGLTGLQELRLSRSKVEGDWSPLLHWDKVTNIELEHTQVSGRLSLQWRGRLPKLRTLKLSHSQVQFIPLPDKQGLQSFQSYFLPLHSEFSAHAILPQLNLLELNGCPLDGDVSDLLLPLCGSPALATIKAAGCRLCGTLTNLMLDKAVVNGVPYLEWVSLLAQSLKVLDLASNNISELKGIPMLQLLILADNSQVNLADGILRQALTSGTLLDLQNDGLRNTTEARDLLQEGYIEKTDQTSSVNPKEGYECYSITSPSLRITAEKFLPDELCSCLPGFEGVGTRCSKCRSNTFSAGNGSTCVACPKGSVAGEGEATCKCTSGGQFRANKSPPCQCPAEHGLKRTLEGKDANETEIETCLPCYKAHLSCPKEGMLLSSAPPEIGFARLRPNDTLALRCLPPKNTRCNSSDSHGSTHFGCASGYMGVLCSDCAAGHYLTSSSKCKACPARTITQQIWKVATLIGGIGLGLLAAAAVLAYLWRASETSISVSSVAPSFSALDAVKEQLQPQVPILLGVCQLWAVLAVLTGGNEGRSTSWEVPYIQATQLSVDSLKGALYLQCLWNGAVVRWASALMAPMAPVVVLLCCLAMEIFRHGLGIAVALKALTLFYVGGALSAFKLLTCQIEDGDKRSLPPELAFRTSVPHLLCYDSSLAYFDAVGYASIVFYGAVVPLCLAYLYVRQHVALLPGKMSVALAEQDGDQWMIRWMELKRISNDSKEQRRPSDAKCLLAASAAYIAVEMHGWVSVSLKDGVVAAKPMSGGESHAERSSAKTQSAGSVPGHPLAQAMVDRCMLEEAESYDRALAGCKQICFKYRRCGNLYMEIIQKLVAVSIVSVVGNADGLQWSLAITLLTAAFCATVQPFLQPQANAVQCCSYLCLALAAVGFSYEFTWLSRGALLVPFLLSAALAAWRPDSAESLAVRIWQQLKNEIPKLEDGKSVEISVETVSFV